MIPRRITREQLIRAAETIERNGIPENRKSTRYNVLVNGNKYPPKYLIAVASKLAFGKMISAQSYNGGLESNSFLRGSGFSITNKIGEIINHP